VTDNRREAASKRAPLKDTLKKLDALDIRRRELAARLNFNFVPRNGQSTLKNGST
jgi:sulfur carrier protein ThiS